MSLAAVGASMSRDGFATPPSHSRRAPPPRGEQRRTAPKQRRQEGHRLYCTSFVRIRYSTVEYRSARVACGFRPARQQFFEDCMWRLVVSMDALMNAPVAGAVADSR